jgi:DNA-binding CsgD family transcriptional regulator
MQSEHRAGGVSRRQADIDLFGAAFGATAALNKLNQGVALIDADRRVRFANHLAHAICDETDGLSLRDNELVGTAMPDAARLDSALRQALLHCQSASLRMTRPSRKRPLSVSISPLPDGGEALGSGAPAALVLIADPDRVLAFPKERLIQAYDLTPAEARVTQLLLQGTETAGIARKLGIQIETARTHVRRVLAKTGTHRQSELIRQLLCEVGWML